MEGDVGDGSAGATGRYLEIEVETDQVDLASGVLWELGVIAVEELEGSDGTALLRTTPIAGVSIEELVRGLRAVLAPLSHRIVDTAATDWLDAWRDHAEPVPAGERIWVEPSWRTGRSAPAGRTAVRIDPGRSFGSGSHQSTRLAIALVEAVLAEHHPSGSSSGPAAAISLLDVGCGSGVLAIAALALGATSARAIDVDPEAVMATAANAADNGVAGRVEVDGTPLELVEGTYDLVVANILAPVLVDLAPHLVERVEEGGHVVVAGFLEDQEASVVAALGRAAERRGGRLEVVGRSGEDGWSACALRAGVNG